LYSPSVKSAEKKRTEAEALVRWDTVKGVECAFGLLDETRASRESGRRSWPSLPSVLGPSVIFEYGLVIVTRNFNKTAFRRVTVLYSLQNMLPSRHVCLLACGRPVEQSL